MSQLEMYAVQRLARTAADRGHYHLGKLLNAAVVSLTNRSVHTESLPNTDRELAEVVAALEPALRQAGLDLRLLAAIQQAREIIAAGNLIFYDAVPAVWVCRVCGEVALDTPPDQCPHCAAGALVFQFFPATFYLEPEPVSNLMTQLSRTADWLDAALQGLSAEQVARRVDGTEGAWSLHEAAGHLLDTQHLIAQRVQLFLEQATPKLNAAALWQTVESTRLSATEMAAEFRLSREAMLTQLRSIPAAHWMRTGQHAEFGPVTLQQQCTYFAKHEHWHMAQITRIRRAL